MKIINKILSIINSVTNYFKTKNKPTYNHYLLSPPKADNTCIPIGNINNLGKDVLGLTILLGKFYKKLNQKHVRRKQVLYLFKEVKKLDELKLDKIDCILVRLSKNNTIHLHYLHQIDTIINNKMYIKHKGKIFLIEFNKIWKLLGKKYKYEE